MTSEPLFRDHDYHPREADVRVFDIPPDGVLRAADGVLVYAARYDDVVLWHYAFAEHWFKVNLTTDRAGNLVETAPFEGAPAYAFNIDLATPLHLDRDAAYAVDLDLDVLVRADGISHVVTDETDFADSVGAGRFSPHEAANAERALAELVAIIDASRLLAFIEAAHPLGPIDALAALSLDRVPVTDVPQIQAGCRLTWAA